MLKLDVINQTLVRGGQNLVATVDQTKASRLVHNQELHALKTVLAANPWDQFKKYATLDAEESGGEPVVPEYEYGYMFQLPVDFCRLVEEEPKGVYYDRVRKRIYSHDSTFQLSYVAFPYDGDWDLVDDIETVTNWSDLPKESEIFDELVSDDQFLDVLVYQILQKIMYTLSGDHNDTQLFGQLYKDALASAKTVQAQQKEDKFITSDTWVDSRTNAASGTPYVQFGEA